MRWPGGTGCFRFGLIVVVLFAVGLSGCTDGPTVKELRPGTPLQNPPVLDAAKARDAINAYRAKNGLEPLELNAKLTQAATIQVEDLAKRDLLDHEGSDGSSPSDRIERVGYQAGLTAENIAAGQKTFEEVLDGWEKSRSHNRNLLLADAKQMGIAVTYDSDTHFRTFWALVMATPRPPGWKSPWE